MTTPKSTLHASIRDNINLYEAGFHKIPEERKKVLEKLAAYIETKLKAGERAEPIFICTHNSRRSHIAQIWAQTAASHYQIPNVIAYSGGTEATAFNPRAVKAMEDAGFKIKETNEGANPLYEVRYADDAPGIKVFSKKYDDAENPKKGFAAIMTCSEADQNCPLVTGAAVRIAIPYNDPKEFDGTPQETAKYAERVHQIGLEIFYAFSLIKV